MAEASDAPLVTFLVRQSDMILLLCGGPVVWYVSQRRGRPLAALGAGQVVRGGAARAIHQLRQVFAALLLGTELLERRSAAAEAPAVAALSHRLNAVVREGIGELALLGEPYPPDLIE